jgi:hypothetical protein
VKLTPEVRAYLRELAAKGGRAGRGAAKRRSKRACRKAGLAGAKARWGK